MVFYLVFWMIFGFGGGDWVLFLYCFNFVIRIFCVVFVIFRLCRVVNVSICWVMLGVSNRFFSLLLRI